MLLFIITTIYTIYKIRVKNIETHRRELAQKVKERTRELSEKATELKKSNKNLEIAKKETDNILSNVNEGLFLLNRDYEIGSQYALILERIFERKKLSHKKFIDLLKKGLDKESLTALPRYFDLMFQNDVDEQTLGQLNPISKTVLKFDGGK
jgi:hypothetical protein